MNDIVPHERLYIHGQIVEVADELLESSRMNLPVVIDEYEAARNERL